MSRFFTIACAMLMATLISEPAKTATKVFETNHADFFLYNAPDHPFGEIIFNNFWPEMGEIKYAMVEWQDVDIYHIGFSGHYRGLYTYSDPPYDLDRGYGPGLNANDWLQSVLCWTSNGCTSLGDGLAYAMLVAPDPAPPCGGPLGPEVCPIIAAIWHDEFAATFSGFGPNAYVRLTVSDEPFGIPEPATWALMILGFGAAGVGLRRETARPKAA
jgi:hypothetical protein